MVMSEFDGDGDREKDYCIVQFSEGVVIDVWEISRRRTDLDYKYCFHYRSDFEKFRENSYRKENRTRKNLALLA